MEDAQQRTATAAFAGRLRRAFEDAKRVQGMTQTRLARAVGVRQGSISAWLNGEYMPKGKFIALLANALGVSATYLVTGRHGDQPPTNASLFREGALAALSAAQERLTSLDEVFLEMEARTPPDAPRVPVAGEDVEADELAEESLPVPGRRRRARRRA